MTLWTDLGFRESPYAIEPLPANQEGDHLLVGREQELARLLTALTSLATAPTVEGDNGVGKTSLVAVAAYRAQRQFEERGSGQLLIPLERIFQLTSEDTPESFGRRVLFEVAHAFITNGTLLRRAGLQAPDVGRVDQWLNAPTIRTAGGGISILGSGASGSGGTAVNTSAGFDEAGFQSAVESWLRDCFPSREVGGFVCVIDNLELLETSARARALLEALRDSILSIAGLRWVLCGARGIMRTAAASPRLEGRLGEPMQLDPIPDELVADVVERRVEAFRMTEHVNPPVEREGFRHLYDVLNANLRNAMKFAEDFSAWLVAEGKHDASPEDRLQLLEVWLAHKAEDHLRDTTGVGIRAWEVFDELVNQGGTCSPSDFESFGFNSTQAFRPQVKTLEDANLVQASVDESDQRRKTIVVAPRGWLVQYQRSGYETTASHQRGVTRG